jgi:hypothetical protein
MHATKTDNVESQERDTSGKKNTMVTAMLKQLEESFYQTIQGDGQVQ